MRPIRYAIQIRNPLRRTYGREIEFGDQDAAIEQAQLAVACGLRARVLEVRRRVVWASPAPRDKQPDEGDHDELEAPEDAR